MASNSPMVQGITQLTNFATVALLPASVHDCLISKSKMILMLRNTQIYSNSDKRLGQERQNVSQTLEFAISLAQPECAVRSEIFVLILCSPKDNCASRILDKKRA
jgi:hypothetical protein